MALLFWTTTCTLIYRIKSTSLKQPLIYPDKSRFGANKFQNESRLFDNKKWF